MSTTMTPAEEEFLAAMNSFRADPTSVKDTISTLKTGIQRLDPKSSMLKEYDNLKKELYMIAPTEPLHYSKELSQAAREYLEKCKQDPPEKNILRNEECKGIAPDSFMQGDSYTMVYFDDSYDSPILSVIRILCRNDDPEKWGKTYLSSELICQVGIAIEEGDENSYVALIFDDDAPVEDEWKADFDDSELKLAFQCLDYNGKNKLNLEEVLNFVDEQGFQNTYPTLVNMLRELKDQGKEYVRYPEFAQHFHSRLHHQKDDPNRDQEIFNVYLPKETEDKSIDNNQLKEIRNFLRLDVTDEQIEEMLQKNENNKTEVDFEEYKNIISGKEK